ncbi:MAG: hypothetical protein JXA21_11225 [Anaerolineae bacterium]|nr:hypothetical protein [Anaerolineae bacterium]
MERIVYPFRRTPMNTLAILAGVIGFVSGVPFLCLSLFSISSLVAMFQSGEFFNSSDPLMALIGIGSAAIAGPVLCLVGAFAIYRGSVPYDAVLTPETFTFGPRGFTRTLRLSEIVKVSISFHPFSKTYAWGVNIEDSRCRRIRLPIARRVATATGEYMFDYPAIVRDLLQRLPAGTVVDDNTKNFAMTGRLS